MAAEMAFVPAEAFTQAEFKRWVERRPLSDANRYELIDGRIVMTPPAGWGHGEIEANVVSILREFVRKHDLGRVFGSSTGYNFAPRSTLEPDASFIAHGRWAKGPHTRPGQFLRIVPNLVVEILSPSTSRRDRLEKKKLYEEHGVDEYWVIDPNRREVTVFRLADGRYSTGEVFTAGQKLRSGVLPGFVVPVRSFFE